MRTLIASLVLIALAVTGSANCALAQGVDMPASSHAAGAGHQPPCHEAMTHSSGVESQSLLHGDHDCFGGAACLDCALAAGLAVIGPAPAAMAMGGTPHGFIVISAPDGVTAHDPPPPRL
ncbi:MAG: hypothetical protein ACQRW7_11665 [Caulobacterales bacterium]|uniref:hypothetical protein n=1 Tax=Glycocaulis sp. TaxID=1969725 RepID=UPI003F9F2B69